MSHYFLETKRLKIRELTENDALPLFEILSDPDTMQFYPKPFDLESSTAWLRNSMKNYGQSGHGLWAVELKEASAFIGQCGITIQDIDGVRVPELGYHINKKFQNKGYCTEAAGACLNYGFSKFGFSEMYIHTYVKNIPSQRIAEKLGMKKLKIYDKYMPSYNLTWAHVVYSLKKPGD